MNAGLQSHMGRALWRHRQLVNDEVLGRPGFGQYDSAHQEMLFGRMYGGSLPQQLDLKSLSQPGLEAIDRPPALPDQFVVQRRIVVQPQQLCRHVHIDVRPAGADARKA